MFPKGVNNVLTLDRVKLMASLIVGYDIDFAQYIQDEIHERDFREITSIPFPYLI